MARRIDWENANRKDRANKPDLPAPKSPGKKSRFYAASRLIQLLPIVESPEWKNKSAAYRRQILQEIYNAASRFAGTGKRLIDSPLIKRAKKILAEQRSNE